MDFIPPIEQISIIMASMKIFYTPIHKEHDPPYEGYNADEQNACLRKSRTS